MIRNRNISKAMTIKLEDTLKELPQLPEFVEGIRRAPKRSFTLTQKETELALKNALRYIPEKWHKKLDFDIALYPYELVTYGETDQVCQNWMQYRLIKLYMENLTQHQTGFDI